MYAGINNIKIGKKVNTILQIYASIDFVYTKYIQNRLVGKIPTPLDVADGNITIVITHHAAYFTDDLQADLQFGSGVRDRN